MEDYPANMMAFEKRFDSEQACLDYVAQVRWAGKMKCPHCGCEKLWRLKAGFECSRCGRQTRILSGTLFEGTHLPLSVWFRAIWWMAVQKNGTSALGLQRLLGLSYKTTWAMLHKIRSVMANPQRTKLSGVVEVDETCIGAVDEGASGRQHGDKSLVVIAAQENGRGIGRVRLSVISEASAKNLLGFIEGNIEPASTVHTDGWGGYAQVGKHGYKHKVSIIKEEGPQVMPRIHLVASLLKRWLLGTHQGAVSREHLQAYLEEFCFRFNRRSSRSRGKLFFRIMEQAVRREPLSYAKIIKHSRPFHRPKKMSF
jgi:transposase-like protein